MAHWHWKLLVEFMTSESGSKRVREVLVDVGVQHWPVGAMACVEQARLQPMDLSVPSQSPGME